VENVVLVEDGGGKEGFEAVGEGRRVVVEGEVKGKESLAPRLAPGQREMEVREICGALDRRAKE
jgi:hypothetical protein